MELEQNSDCEGLSMINYDEFCKQVPYDRELANKLDRMYMFTNFPMFFEASLTDSLKDDLLKKTGYNRGISHKTKHKTLKTLNNINKDANIFLLEDTCFNEKGQKEIYNTNISFPFDTCIFESKNKELFICTFDPDEMKSTKITIHIKSLLVKEIRPEEYAAFFIGFINNGGDIYTLGDAFIVNDDGNFDQRLNGMFLFLFKMVCYYLNTSQLGREAVNIRSTTKQNGIFRTNKINKIIHVMPKKETRWIKGLQNEIDWSHRWAVRGHWRKTKDLGKDRHGEYKIRGFTWVKDHVKGPEDKVLVTDKIRVSASHNLGLN